MGISPSPIHQNSAIRPCTSRAVARPEHGNVSASYSYYRFHFLAIRSGHCRCCCAQGQLLSRFSFCRTQASQACVPEDKTIDSVIQRTPLPRTGSQMLIIQLETARVDVRSVRTPRSRKASSQFGFAEPTWDLSVSDAARAIGCTEAKQKRPYRCQAIDSLPTSPEINRNLHCKGEVFL
jgi:hypothetical protein